MKTLVVGDLHGNIEVCLAALNQKTTDNIIFLGDYLDSFNRSAKAQAQCLFEVLNAIEFGSKNVIGLLGNHERSYFNDELCSGWNSETQALVDLSATRAARLLKVHLMAHGYLITHAGVSQLLLDDLGLSLEQYLEKGDFVQIGKRRGGADNVGGLYWNDFTTEFEPIDGVKQIFGHTHYRHNGAMKVIGDNYNIDCLPQFDVLKMGEPAYGLMIDDTGAQSVDIFNL